ncbi:hypothetical protein HHI36_006338, partial [Cryptolaemus montrouzieri]
DLHIADHLAQIMVFPKKTKAEKEKFIKTRKINVIGTCLFIDKLKSERWECLLERNVQIAFDGFQRRLLYISDQCFLEKRIKIGPKNKPKIDATEILTLQNQLEAAQTIASVRKDERPMNLLKFLKHKLKKEIQKQIKYVDTQKMSLSENKSKAIWEIIKSRINTKYNSKDTLR